MKWIYTFFSQYANFKGRSNRIELSLYLLFIISLVQTISHFAAPTELNDYLFILAMVLCIPTLAMLTRRLHDQSKGTHLILLLLIPIAGLFILSFFALQSGKPYKNKYGAATNVNLKWIHTFPNLIKSNLFSLKNSVDGLKNKLSWALTKKQNSLDYHK